MNCSCDKYNFPIRIKTRFGRRKIPKRRINIISMPAQTGKPIIFYVSEKEFLVSSEVRLVKSGMNI